MKICKTHLNIFLSPQNLGGIEEPGLEEGRCGCRWKGTSPSSQVYLSFTKCKSGHSVYISRMFYMSHFFYAQNTGGGEGAQAALINEQEAS